MSKTTAELATRVLQRLKVIGAGEVAQAADAQAVQDYYANIFGEMEDDGLTFWEQDAIDERAFEALADFIAGRIATDFGVQRPDLEQSGTVRLRRLAADVHTGFVVAGCYF